MEENQLIKYNKEQIEKVNNLVSITNKLLIESNNVQKETFETDKRLLAMMAIKKQVMELRAEKQTSSIQTVSEEILVSREEKFNKQLDYINNLPQKQQAEFRRRLAMVARKVKKGLKQPGKD